MAKPDDYLRKVNAKIRAQSKPFCLTNLFLDRPCCFIFLNICLLSFLTWLSFRLDVWQQNNAHPRDFLVYGSKEALDWDMQVAAENYLLKASS